MNRIHFLNQLAETRARYNLGAGVPPLDLYPKFDFERSVATYRDAHPKDSLLNYHATEGMIRSLAAEALSKNEGHPAATDHVMVTNGVQEAISLTALQFQNQTIACRDPYYPGFVDAVRMTGNTVTYVTGDHWLDQVGRLPEGSLFYLSADFANPTGARISINERRRLLQVAEARNLYIFDDATYREFDLDGRFPALWTFGPERVIHAMSFSKILAPGLRTAFVHLPQALAPSFSKLKANLSLNNSGLTQAAVAGWLLEQNFQFGAHLANIKQRLRENGNVIRENGAKFSGGFFAELDLGQPLANLSWSSELLEEESIAVCPMSLFSDDPAALSRIRLAVANISSTDLQQAIDIMFRFVQ
jgi:DNA-binding transcriptional MocR family regulator